jgi:hypothetical protein
MATKKKTKRSAAPRAMRTHSSGRGPLIKLNATRERINRQGYDARGRYWGIGEKLWRVSVVDPTTDVYVDEHVRAANSREAKTKVIAAMMKGLSMRAEHTPAERDLLERSRSRATRVPHKVLAAMPAGAAHAASRSGYTACACRDCFDTAMSKNVKRPELCNDCKAAGCEANNGECQRADAYGGG